MNHTPLYQHSGMCAIMSAIRVPICVSYRMSTYGNGEYADTQSPSYRYSLITKRGSNSVGIFSLVFVMGYNGDILTWSLTDEETLYLGNDAVQSRYSPSTRPLDLRDGSHRRVHCGCQCPCGGLCSVATWTIIETSCLIIMNKFRKWKVQNVDWEVSWFRYFTNTSCKRPWAVGSVHLYIAIAFAMTMHKTAFNNWEHCQAGSDLSLKHQKPVPMRFYCKWYSMNHVFKHNLSFKR